MKAVKETERKYYKYQEEYRTFVQPVLTSNGILGGDSFAVDSNTLYISSCPAWNAFDGTRAVWWGNSSDTINYYIIYNPNPLNIKNINIKNYNGDGASLSGYFYSSSGSVYGSDDGVEWVIIKQYSNNIYAYNATWDISLAENTNYYKYYKIDSNSYHPFGSEGWSIQEIILTADENARILNESDESDYDFYTDKEVYKLPREVDIKYFKTIFEQAVAGDYEITVEQDGNYIVEMYGAGGGWASARWATDIWYGTTVGGGSGAGFKGIVNLTAGNYAITVGKAGENVHGGWNYEATGETGGSTSLNNLIIAGGGIGGYGYYVNATAGKGGSITINPSVEVISDSINSTGNDGSVVGFAGSGDPHTVNGGASLYNGSQTGYGAGGGYPNNAVDGYIKIMQQTTEEESTTSEIKCTYFAIGE